MTMLRLLIVLQHCVSSCSVSF